MNNNTIKVDQTEINKALWGACDTFRGAFDSSEYKNYILVFMFLKYMSDIWKDHYAELKAQYGDDETLIQRKLNRERFVLPENCTFEYLHERRNATNIGEEIDKVLAKIEDKNITKLEGVFRNISFNSDKLGQTADRNRRLKNLLEDFARPVLDFRPSVIGNTEDILGNAYMFLIGEFASGAGKKGGEFYTPAEVSELLAQLVSPKEGARICDPACGSASLLIKVAEQVKTKEGKPSRDFALYGQESNGDTWALSKLNMFLHDMDSARIEWCDTINNPQLIENDHLMKFDVVVANPPFSLDKWGDFEQPSNDRFGRFHRGLPPKSKGDFAFISHMIEVTLPDGRVGVIVPHGVLFRGAAEGKIRTKLIDENMLEAVIGLPSNLFFGTGIPTAIVIFNKSKKNDKVLFVDASKEYQEGKKQNKLRKQDIEKIVTTYRSFEVIEKYSNVVDLAVIRENDYNLNIPRYVDTFEEEEEIDLVQVKANIAQYEKELVAVKAEMQQYLAELGL
ncbi:type I restriction-modification system subunit M [Myroides odoratimimus]|uniref:type I restriction-modification system subunit M n=1 Tax=Myroides odoratimimus TaxID=76832 RepID=UPI001CE08F06|nr:type I restriction-modification system subunit M [Myroides odoratimimus]MCA4792691.1 type I restriction-modification system subunit M [Myroides odoratimimus]MCA4819867.1 type I restriction-modification system subunit M [Myroides odoratimimus]MDM1401238.1 type I restriction-modification system subunit M [Myroides odoratimimus]MDM1457212.1 type I restriction-modification system subunit M [Myroides odoratimimus]MEC4085769.1 type I restriction-modification system subunit M [Myroides odoratimimu